MLKQKFYSNLPDHHDGMGECESHVVVEWLKAHEMQDGEVRTIKCYIPADAWKDSNGDVIVCYEHHPKGTYDPYLIKYKYCEGNMPNTYDFASIGFKECMLLALGVLLGYDETEDCFKPFLDYVDDNGKNVYQKWTDIEPLKDNWKIWTEC